MSQGEVGFISILFCAQFWWNSTSAHTLGRCWPLRPSSHQHDIVGLNDMDMQAQIFETLESRLGIDSDCQTA